MAKTVLRSCARNFEVEHNRSYSTWLVVVKHEQGSYWSVFYEELLERLFANLPSVERVTSQRSDKQVAVEILAKPAVKPKFGPTQKTGMEIAKEEPEEESATRRIVSEG